MTATEPSETEVTSKPGNQTTAAPKPPAIKKEARLSPGLYIVATPIGNARDITLRALDVLAATDVIACEDTRVTARLLAIHGIDTRCTPYHDHNAARVRPGLLSRLAAGDRVALVSDAGTPLISDPGYRLIREASARGVAVWPVPGASAVMASLMVAGVATDRFMFAGFLPSRAAARRRALEALKDVDATVVLFESTRRLPKALADMAAVLGERDAVVARELTKLHEETRRGTLSELAAHYRSAGPPKGEAVVVIGPPGEPRRKDWDIDDLLFQALKTVPVSTAARVVADISRRPRREVYARALTLAGNGKSDDR